MEQKEAIERAMEMAEDDAEKMRLSSKLQGVVAGLYGISGRAKVGGVAARLAYWQLLLLVLVAAGHNGLLSRPLHGCALSSLPSLAMLFQACRVTPRSAFLCYAAPCDALLRYTALLRRTL